MTWSTRGESVRICKKLKKMKRELSKIGEVIKQLFKVVWQGENFWFFPNPSMVLVKKDQKTHRVKY